MASPRGNRGRTAGGQRHHRLARKRRLGHPWCAICVAAFPRPLAADCTGQVAQLPNFGDFATFALLTPTQYLPAPPPTLTSELYATDFEEVRLLGSATSAVRAAEQTETARLFASVGNITSHFAAWNNVARDVARQAHWSLIDTARLFVLINVSMQDGVQTSQTSKFIYGLWRPITAIHRHDEDLNPATMADPAWTPLLSTPPYPSHSSNQTCVGTSAARALARVFGRDDIAFSVTWIGTGGNANVTRHYGSFSEPRSSRRAAASTEVFISTSSSRQARKVARRSPTMSSTTTFGRARVPGFSEC